MKSLRTLLLVLALSGPVYAGVIQNGVTQPPPPDPITAEATDEPTETAEQTPTVTDVFLTVVRVLGLL
jgi:hypothetical protein